MSTPDLQLVERPARPAVPPALPYVVETEQLELRFGRRLALKSLSLKIPPGRRVLRHSSHRWNDRYLF